MHTSHKTLTLFFCFLISAMFYATNKIYAANNESFVEHVATVQLLSAEQTINNAARPARDQQNDPCSSTLNRAGYGIASNINTHNGVIKDLNGGLFLDWKVNATPVHPNCAEYIQVIRVKQVVNCNEDIWNPDTCNFVEPYQHTFSPSISAVIAAARARPGSIWLVGNEIDRYGQDYMLPDYYAEVYHDFYEVIKGADATAQIAIAGVVQPTPLRLEYLTKVWDTYQSKYGQTMPVDVWNVHNFIMQEKSGTSVGAGIPPGLDATEGWDPPGNNIDAHINIGIFGDQIRAFRQWMKDRGQQEKPLIVSEYGVLFWHCEDDAGNVVEPPCANDLYSPDKVGNFMVSSFDYFLNTADCNLGYSPDGCRLVQRWVWYALNEDGTGAFNPETYLYRGDTNALSHVGGMFRDYVRDHVNDDYKPESVGGTGDIGQAISLPTENQDRNIFLPLIVR